MTLHPRIYFFRILLITLVISISAHLLLIFYLPPLEEMEFLSLKNGAQSPTPPLQITIQGDMSSGTTKTQVEQLQGEFGDQAGVDKEKWADLLSKLNDTAGLSSSFKQSFDDINTKFNVKKSYIYRPRNHEDIVIKDVFPTIHTIDKPFSDILNAAPQDLEDHNERNKIIKAYRDWSLNKSKHGTLFISINNDENNDALSPLVFPKPEREVYFDENLTLPKGLQLSNFIRKYFSFDPDKGDLPIATRELYYDNLQRLAYSFSSDPSYLYLDYFLENLNKEDFLKNALYQASILENSKTQTELLFALEDIYHIQQRAWRYYFEYDKLYPSIPVEKQQHLRNETLRRVVAGYKDVLKTKNIDNYAQIENLYRLKRREILDYILTHTPKAYRQSDALFEKAAMNWQQGITEKKPELKLQAIKQWMAIPLDTTMPRPTPITTATTAATPSERIDNLTQISLQKLKPVLNNYLSDNTVTKQGAENIIQRIIATRHSPRITKKRMREETLLWKE